MTFPLLNFDGQTHLLNTIANGIASTSYPGETDAENFIALNSNPTLTSSVALRSSYGDLVPVQATTSDATANTFIYPSGLGDPSAASVKESFVFTGTGFTSLLGRVDGTLYVGRTSAGGFGSGIDLNGDGVADALFGTACTFILQLDNGLITNVEVDRAESAMIGGQTLNLTAYSPVAVPEPATGMLAAVMGAGLLSRRRRNVSVP